MASDNKKSEGKKFSNRDTLAPAKSDRVIQITTENIQSPMSVEGDLLKADKSSENRGSPRGSSGTESKYETEPSEKSDENISDVSARCQRTAEKRRKRKVGSTVPLVPLHKNSQSDNSSIDSKGSRNLEDYEGERRPERRPSESAGAKRPFIGYVRPHGGKKSQSVGGRHRAKSGTMVAVVLSKDESSLLLVPPGGASAGRASCSKTLSTPITYSLGAQADAKVQRRTSYRIATNKHKSASGKAEEGGGKAKLSEEKDLMDGASAAAKSVTITTTAGQNITVVTAETALMKSAVSKSTVGGSSLQAVELRQKSEVPLLSLQTVGEWGGNPEHPPPVTTPTKSTGIRRLKELFSDKTSPKEEKPLLGSQATQFQFEASPPTPRTTQNRPSPSRNSGGDPSNVSPRSPSRGDQSPLFSVSRRVGLHSPRLDGEMTSHHRHQHRRRSIPNVHSTISSRVSDSTPSFEGHLNCKNTFLEGRHSTDRNWKSVYMILRGHSLHMHPDQTSLNSYVYDHPISIRRALVDIAYEYVKRRNVFRVTTLSVSEYLLEAPDQPTMLQWIKQIQTRSEPSDHSSSKHRDDSSRAKESGGKRRSSSSHHHTKTSPNKHSHHSEHRRMSTTGVNQPSSRSPGRSPKPSKPSSPEFSDDEQDRPLTIPQIGCLKRNQRNIVQNLHTHIDDLANRLFKDECINIYHLQRITLKSDCTNLERAALLMSIMRNRSLQHVRLFRQILKERKSPVYELTDIENATHKYCIALHTLSEINSTSIAEDIGENYVLSGKSDNSEHAHISTAEDVLSVRDSSTIHEAVDVSNSLYAVKGSNTPGVSISFPIALKAKLTEKTVVEEFANRKSGIDVFNDKNVENVIGLKHSESIIAYLSCSSMESLVRVRESVEDGSMKNSLENLYNDLLSKNTSDRLKVQRVFMVDIKIQEFYMLCDMNNIDISEIMLDHELLRNGKKEMKKVFKAHERELKNIKHRILLNAYFWRASQDIRSSSEDDSAFKTLCSVCLDWWKALKVKGFKTSARRTKTTLQRKSAPAIPTGLRISNITKDSCTLRWTSSKCSDSSTCKSIKFVVQSKTTDSERWINNMITSDYSVNLQNLATGKYEFRVVAMNQDGVSQRGQKSIPVTIRRSPGRKISGDLTVTGGVLGKSLKSPTLSPSALTPHKEVPSEFPLLSPMEPPFAITPLSSMPNPGATPKSAPSTAEHHSASETKSKERAVSTWKSKMAKRLKRLSVQQIQQLQPAASSSGALSPAFKQPASCFGIPLETCSPSTTNEFVPRIVEICTQLVESKGLQNKGIYRVPGNSAAITTLQAEIEKDPAGLNLDNKKWNDVNAVISLLKMFFRRLPEPLITEELYPQIIEANRVSDNVKRMLKLKRLLSELPPHNFETFFYLSRHLQKVANLGQTNMMDARNLAIVFGPTLLQPRQENMVSMVKEMSDQCRVVESIILHCEWFFGSWDEDVNVPVMEGSTEASSMTITGMDQQLLEKAQLMELEQGPVDKKKAMLRQSSHDSVTGSTSKVKAAQRWEKCTSAYATISTPGVGVASPPGAFHGGSITPPAYNERNIDEEVLIRGSSAEKNRSRSGSEKSNRSRAQSMPPKAPLSLDAADGITTNIDQLGDSAKVHDNNGVTTKNSQKSESGQKSVSNELEISNKPGEATKSSNVGGSDFKADNGSVAKPVDGATGSKVENNDLIFDEGGGKLTKHQGHRHHHHRLSRARSSEHRDPSSTSRLTVSSIYTGRKHRHHSHKDAKPVESQRLLTPPDISRGSRRHETSDNKDKEEVPVRRTSPAAPEARALMLRRSWRSSGSKDSQSEVQSPKQLTATTNINQSISSVELSSSQQSSSAASKASIVSGGDTPKTTTSPLTKMPAVAATAKQPAKRTVATLTTPVRASSPSLSPRNIPTQKRGSAPRPSSMIQGSKGSPGDLAGHAAISGSIDSVRDIKRQDKTKEKSAVTKPSPAMKGKSVEAAAKPSSKSVGTQERLQPSGSPRRTLRSGSDVTGARMVRKGDGPSVSSRPDRKPAADRKSSAGAAAAKEVKGKAHEEKGSQCDVEKDLNSSAEAASMLSEKTETLIFDEKSTQSENLDQSDSVKDQSQDSSFEPESHSGQDQGQGSTSVSTKPLSDATRDVDTSGSISQEDFSNGNGSMSSEIHENVQTSSSTQSESSEENSEEVDLSSHSESVDQESSKSSSGQPCRPTHLATREEFASFPSRSVYQSHKNLPSKELQTKSKEVVEPSSTKSQSTASQHVQSHTTSEPPGASSSVTSLTSHSSSVTPLKSSHTSYHVTPGHALLSHRISATLPPGLTPSEMFRSVAAAEPLPNVLSLDSFISPRHSAKPKRRQSEHLKNVVHSSDTCLDYTLIRPEKLSEPARDWLTAEQSRPIRRSLSAPILDVPVIQTPVTVLSPALSDGGKRRQIRRATQGGRRRQRECFGKEEALVLQGNTAVLHEAGVGNKKSFESSV